MTATFTRQRNRDSMSLEQAKTILDRLGYEVRHDFESSPGTVLALLAAGGFHVTVVLAEHQVHAHQVVLLSRTDEDGVPSKLLRFVDSQLVNHERVPLDVPHAVASARKFARDAARAGQLAAGAPRWAVTR